MSRLQTLGRYPVGESYFPEIRKNKQVYVDKTALIYRLAKDSKYYFLSRPRRFGKSLMLSTLRAYFEGKKELFDGLAISHLEQDWEHYPVIHLSMGGEDFSSSDALSKHLDFLINTNQTMLSVTTDGETPASRFKSLIQNASVKFGKSVVILIDEYDKPMLDTRHINQELHDGIKRILRGFYGCIKESAEFIRFVMITGVTKFSHVNIFSGLNNLKDISLLPEYNALCGISESEMTEYFSEDMEVFAKRNNITLDQTAAEFKLHYDGYRFASVGENIYNPFSTILAFSNMAFGNYWFASGTSMHLVEELKRNNYNFSKIGKIRVTADEMMREPSVENGPTALLYQAGYLTIKDYVSGFYTLDFPNKEVQSGFYNDLVKLLVPVSSTEFSGPLLALYARECNVDAMMEMLQLGLSRFNNMEMQKPELEYHVKVILKALLMAAALDVEGEVLSQAGRIDMVLKTSTHIYLFEFKINGSPQKALAQIDANDYPFRFHGDPRPIIKIGANYSTRYRRLTGWETLS